MFAYLISKLLCNIYRDVRAEKSASLERTKTSFGSVETLRETYLESLLKRLSLKQGTGNGGTGNEERGTGNGERGTGNGERGISKRGNL